MGLGSIGRRMQRADEVLARTPGGLEVFICWDAERNRPTEPAYTVDEPLATIVLLPAYALTRGIRRLVSGSRKVGVICRTGHGLGGERVHYERPVAPGESVETATLALTREVQSGEVPIDSLHRGEGQQPRG